MIEIDRLVPGSSEIAIDVASDPSQTRGRTTLDPARLGLRTHYPSCQRKNCRVREYHPDLHYRSQQTVEFNQIGGEGEGDKGQDGTEYETDICLSF